MSRSPGARFLALLVLLALLPPPGHGNEGSVIGSCYCHRRIPSNSPPKGEVMAHFRKHLRAYDRCNSYIRFQLHSRSVCGGSKDAWVQELVSWFDRKEYGYANSGSAAPQELLPPPSTQFPEPTQRAPLDTGSPAPTHLPPALQSTKQPTLPAGAQSLDRNLTHADDITTSTEGHGRGPEERQKQLEERVGPSARTSAMVPVVSLLTIIFILTVVLLYVLCRRRREQSLQHRPDLPLYYTPVASDSSA